MKLDLSLSSLFDLVELLNCTYILAEFSTELKCLSAYACILESKRESLVWMRKVLKNGWTVSTEGLKRAVLNNITHIVRYALNVMLSSMVWNVVLYRVMFGTLPRTSPEMHVA